MKPHACEVEDCPFKTTSPQLLKQHFNRIHIHQKPIKKYGCKLCNYKASLKVSLERHVRHIHTKEKPFSCDQCDYKAAVKHNVDKHIKVVHEKPFSCQQCPYKTAQKSTLERHFKQFHAAIVSEPNLDHIGETSNDPI